MRTGPLYVFLCYILWGVLPIFWKLLGDVNPAYTLASRIAWSLLFCTLILLFQKNLKKIKDIFKDKKQCLLLFGCGVMVSINWGFYILAVSLGHILEGSLAYYLNPILSILAGCLFYKEKLTKLQWLSVVVAFIGVLISIIRYGQIPYLAIIIGTSFAIYGAMKKRVTATSEVSIFIETLSVTPFALVYIIYAEFHGIGSIGVLHNWEFLYLPLTGVITSIPLLFFAIGIKNTSLSLSGILMYINPTLQLIIGVVLYHEQFTSTNAITFGFIWVALILFVSNTILNQNKKRFTMPKMDS